MGTGPLDVVGVGNALVDVISLETDEFIGRHGLVVTRGPRRGLLLPQVATKHGFEREQFLDETCAKAGLDAGAWKEAGTAVEAFTAEVFAESQNGGDPPAPRKVV